MLTESQRSADLETRRTTALAALTNESRSWLRNSLEHNRKEFMARASQVRRRFAGSTTNAQYAAASELIGQVYDEAAWAFARALESLLGPGGLAELVDNDSALWWLRQDHVCNECGCPSDDHERGCSAVWIELLAAAKAALPHIAIDSQRARAAERAEHRLALATRAADRSRQ